MLEYLEKFESLPIDLRKKVSNKEVVDKIYQLENKYGLDLVPLIIKVIIKDIGWNDLIQFLMEDFSIDVISAENLKDDLATQVFYNIADYLGIEGVKKEEEHKENVFLPKTKEEKRLPAYKHDNDEFDLVKIKEEKEKSARTAADKSLAHDSKGELDAFDEEEKEELEEIALSMDFKDKDNKEKRDEKFIQMLDDIIKEVEVSLSSEASQSRFRNIILTYLKGIRTKAKTRYALAKDFDKGGLGLGEKTIDNIIFLSDKYINLNNTDNKEEEKRKDSIFDFDEETELGGPDIPSKNYYNKPDKQEDKDSPAEKKKSLDLKNMPNRDIEYDLSSLKKSFGELAKNKAKDEEESDILEEDKEEDTEYNLEEILKRNLEEKEENKNSQEIKKKENLKKSKEESGPVKKIEKESAQSASGAADESLSHDLKEEKKVESENKKEDDIISNFSQEEDDIVKQDKKIKRKGESVFGFKKKINDIKKPPKLLNPVSELKYIDLFTFRRLGDSPQKRIEKIKEKISNLEKKFFYRKVQGVQAWRQSPVNRIYLNMGNESIVYSKSIDDIIKGRKKENKDYLEKDEFESIMDLNNDLKYY
jgi:hypothetical protein